MTNCPRCGLQVRPGMPACPRCNTPLSPDAGAPPWPQQYPGQQPQGWPGGPGPQQGYGPQRPGLAVGGLVSEEALPAWLRAGDQGAPMPGTAPGWGPPNAPGWGGQPAPPSGGFRQAPGGPPSRAANPFDESALPDWLRQGPNAADPRVNPMNPMGPPQAPYPQAGTGTYPGYNGYAGAPGGYTGGQNGMAAGALLDDRALPGWLNQSPGGNYGPGAGAQQSGREGLSASSLIDESALPQWLRGGSRAAAPAGQWGATAAQEPLPAWLAQAGAAMAPPPAGARPPVGSVNGGQLADESALPDWLRAQTPQGAHGPGGNGAARGGAGGLMDPGALPPWLQAGVADDPRFGAPPGQSQARQPVNSEWLTDAHVPAAGAGAPGDTDLPAWLRNQPPGQSHMGGAPAGPRRGADPAEPLRTAEMPSWLREGSGVRQGARRGPGGAAGSSARRRSPRDGDARPDESAQWAGSRVRAPRDDPRAYGRGENDGDEYDGDEYDGDGYEEWDEAPRDDGGHQRRGGIFGRFRRK